MQRRIVFKEMVKGTEWLAANVSYHEEFVANSLVGALKDGVTRVEDDPFLAEATSGYVDWAIDEAMKFGVMGLYHLWEKQVKTLLQEQLGKEGFELARKTARSQLSASHRNDAAILLHILEHELSAPSSADARDIIEECRQLANLIKHDAGDGYQRVEENYPSYFRAADGDDAEERFRITPDAVRRLCRGVERFWVDLPVHHDLSEIVNALARGTP